MWLPIMFILLHLNSLWWNLASSGWQRVSERTLLNSLSALYLASLIWWVWHLYVSWLRARRLGWRLTHFDLLFRGLALMGIARRLVPRHEAEVLPGFDIEKSDFQNLRKLVRDDSISLQ